MKLSTAFVFLLLIALSQCSSLMIANSQWIRRRYEYTDQETIGQLKARFISSHSTEIPESDYVLYKVSVAGQKYVFLDNDRTVSSYNLRQDTLLHIYRPRQ